MKLNSINTNFYNLILNIKNAKMNGQSHKGCPFIFLRGKYVRRKIFIWRNSANADNNIK